MSFRGFTIAAAGGALAVVGTLFDSFPVQMAFQVMAVLLVLSGFAVGLWAIALLFVGNRS